MACLSHNISEDGKQAIKPWSAADYNQLKAQILSRGVKSGSDLFQSLNLRGKTLPSELRCMVLPQPKQHRSRRSYLTSWWSLSHYQFPPGITWTFCFPPIPSVKYTTPPTRQATWWRCISHNTPWYSLLLTPSNIWRDWVPSNEIWVSCLIQMLVWCRRMGM